jgi:aspartate 1-decarboxylase
MKLRILVAVALVASACSVVMGENTAINRYSNSVQAPVMTGNSVTNKVTANSNAVATIPANSNRIGGYVVNLSTNAIMISLTGSTTTTIDADNVVLAAYSATSNEDTFYFRDGTVIYTGAIYATNLTTNIDVRVVELVK